MIDNFQDLNIGAFLRLYDIPEDIEPLDRQVAILAVLSGCSEDEILALPLDEYSRRVNASRFLDRDLPQRAPQRAYRVGRYTLVPVRDFRKMTTAQFVDFKTFADLGEDARRYTVEMLSCLMVPEGRDYCDGYDPVDVQAAIRDHLRADDAVCLSAFFLSRWMRLSRAILTSSRRIARRQKRRDLLAKIREATRTRRLMLRTPSRRSGAGSR